MTKQFEELVLQIMLNKQRNCIFAIIVCEKSQHSSVEQVVARCEKKYICCKVETQTHNAQETWTEQQTVPVAHTAEEIHIQVLVATALDKIENNKGKFVTCAVLVSVLW